MVGTLLLSTSLFAAGGVALDYPIQPLPFTAVTFDDVFWGPRLETNRTVTIPYDFQKCEETGRISNFEKAGGLKEGVHQGIYFDDSDVYKVVEGAAYSLALHPDPDLEAYLDDLIAKFAAAQEDDGYLYTARTIDPEKPARGAGSERWEDIRSAHELYCVGHMYEAAAAHYQATGKRSLLDIALKNADLIDQVFGPNGRRDPPGHQEIEIGLARLYRVTGEQRYLDLAKFFLDQRGQAEGRQLYGPALQDHLPVLEQEEGVGHAVRAGYLYSGMADVAALAGDKAYIAAIDRIWENVVSKKIYLTGGIGATRLWEGFGENYVLPNRTGYNETCAAIASAMWNHRLFLLHGDAKYIDVLERTIYNGFLSGIALGGDAFFYPNPLEADGVYAFNQGAIERQPWFGCSCCPSNVVRFLPSLLGYAYAHRDNGVFVNLFVAGSATIPIGAGTVRIEQATRYPWDGAVAFTVTPDQTGEFALHIRVPGWAEGRPLPSDLYVYADSKSEGVTLAVNGEQVAIEKEQGFAVLRRAWKAGDTVTLHLPMPIRRVHCDEAVEANRGKVALERGPLVYCAEHVDNAGRVFNVALPDSAALEAQWRGDLLGGVMTIGGTAQALHRGEEGDETVAREQPFAAIPYYAWAHRGAGEMAVWLPRDVADAMPPRRPTIAGKSDATASHTNSGDVITALNDQQEPESSKDHGIPCFTWWDRKGTREWVQYDFAEAVTVSAVEVYWFDDGPEGGCRVPASWRLRYRKGDRWRRVETDADYIVKKDGYNRVEFAPVETDALRIEVKLQGGFSAGILEWTVNEG